MIIKRLSGTILLGFFCFSGVLGQHAYLLGTLPAINLNKGLNDRWAINAKWESRQEISRGFFGGAAEGGAGYVLSDLSIISSVKVGLQSKLAGGYLIRLNGDRPTHRSIQQFSLVQEWRGFRLGHRFATDQTFAPETATSYRFRYRLGVELPFNGQSVDPKELYLKATHEYLYRLRGGSSDLEVRLAPFLGYRIAGKHKVEFGLNYRLSSFLNGGSKNSFWMQLIWYAKI